MSNFITAMVYGETQLRWVLPGVRTAYEKTRDDAAAEGITIVVADFGGARTEGIVSQLIKWRDEAVAAGQGTYRVAPYGRTKHALGGAVDFRVTKHPATMTDAQAYARVAALARPHGLLWGGNFSDPADPFHLESQQTLDQLAPRWAAWQKDPAFPRLGAADWSLLAVMALLFVLFILLVRSR